MQMTESLSLKVYPFYYNFTKYTYVTSPDTGIVVIFPTTLILMISMNLCSTVIYLRLIRITVFFATF